MILPLSLFCVENHVCLSHGVQVTVMTWRAVMRIMAGVGDLVQITGDGQTQASNSVVEQSRGWVTLCAVCIVRWGARVSWFGLKTKVDDLSVIWPQNNWVRFPGLDLKTDSYGLVIRASKSPWWFIGLGLKTKRATVCQLRHKTYRRMKTAWGTRQDLAACFTWKQVGLCFPSLASRLMEARCGWCTWHHRRGCVELKLKTDGSMRQAASDPCTPTLSFSMY
jgi:hypothetical protein